MKKNFTVWFLALAIAMLASLCACNSRDEPQSSNELLTSALRKFLPRSPRFLPRRKRSLQRKRLVDMTEETESYAE